jgi:excisionase family DNA binding protein
VIKEFYSPAELSERWGVSVNTIRNLMYAGALSGLRVGQQVRFSIHDVMDYEDKYRIDKSDSEAK